MPAGLPMVGDKPLASRSFRRRYIFSVDYEIPIDISARVTDTARLCRRPFSYQSLTPVGTGVPRCEKPELWLGTADRQAGFCHSPPMPLRGTSPRATLLP